MKVMFTYRMYRPFPCFEGDGNTFRDNPKATIQQENKATPLWGTCRYVGIGQERVPFCFRSPLNYLSGRRATQKI